MKVGDDVALRVPHKATSSPCRNLSDIHAVRIDPRICKRRDVDHARGASLRMMTDGIGDNQLERNQETAAACYAALRLNARVNAYSHVLLVSQAEEAGGLP